MNCGHFLFLALVLYVNLVDVDCGVTVEQLAKTSDMIRSVCQPRVKITTEMADGIGQGKFPDDKSLKCYAQCVLEMTGVMKKNKLNYEAAMKQMDKLLPDDIVDDNKNGITQCKDAAVGVKDACEAAFVLVQCMYKNNKKFTFA